MSQIYSFLSFLYTIHNPLVLPYVLRPPAQQLSISPRIIKQAPFLCHPFHCSQRTTTFSSDCRPVLAFISFSIFCKCALKCFLVPLFNCFFFYWAEGTSETQLKWSHGGWMNALAWVSVEWWVAGSVTGRSASWTSLSYGVRLASQEAFTPATRLTTFLLCVEHP